MNDTERLAELKKENEKDNWEAVSLDYLNQKHADFWLKHGDWLIGLAERGLQMEKALVKCEPRGAYSDTDNYGCSIVSFDECVLCGVIEGQDHKPDCLWRQAVERQKERGDG